MSAALPPEALRFLREARVGHLATVDADGTPSVVPVCFALEGARIYSVIDAKPKRLPPERLRRVRNLRARPGAALVVDRWHEDWGRLGWLHVRGRAELIGPGDEHARGLGLLREKYPQYREMALDEAPMIRLTIETHQAWGDLSQPPFAGE